MKFPLLCFVLLSRAASFAAEIQGRIVDPSGAAIERATVTVVSRDGALRRTVQTDSGGGFHIGGLSEGEYIAEAHASGLASSGAVTLLAGAPAKDIRLGLAEVRASVQVTANAGAETADEAAKAVDVIQREQLDARAEITVIESLRLTPGIRVQQLGGPASTARVQARGMRSSDTAVLIDGFRLRDAASTQGDAAGFMSDLVLVNTDRIEVLRGSGASLYGSNASAAVVNLVTDSGGGPLRGDVSAEGGGLGMARGLARVGGGAFGDRLRFSGGASHLNLTRGVDSQDRARNSGAQGSAQFTALPGTLLHARLYASDAYLDLNDTPFAAAAANLPRANPVEAVAGVTFTPALNDPDNQRTARLFSGLFGVTQQLSPGATLRGNYQAVASRRDFRDGPAGIRFEPLYSNLSRFDGRIHTLQSRLDWRAAPWTTISGGYEWEREWFDNLSADDHPDASRRAKARATVVQRSHSAFAQDQLRLMQGRVLISLSGRFQNFQLHSPRFEGGLGAYADITPAKPRAAFTGDASLAYLIARSGTKLRAHAGNGYRAPSLYERFGSFFSGSFSPLGDPRLRPERLASLDAGADQYLFANKLRLSATFFYTRIQEAIAFEQGGVITPASDPYGRFGGYWNTGGGLARGIETSAEAQPYRTTSLRASYTYTNADERVSAVAGGILDSPRILAHMMTLLATQRFGRRWDASADFAAGSDYLHPMSRRAFRFDGPRKLDLAAGYTHPLRDGITLRAYIRAENLLGRVYYEDGFPTPGRWAVAGLKLAF